MRLLEEPRREDALFKYVFSQPEHAAGELQSMLPPEIVRHVDWSSLEVVPASFVDPELADQHADLLYSVRLAGRAAFVYLLLEHKSRVDPRTPFQLLRYLVRIWERFLKEAEEAAGLPAILPLVVYHGRSGWTAARELLELVDLDPELRPLVAPFVPTFRFLLDDLAVEDEEALAQRTLSALATLALLCLKRARESGDLLAELRRWTQAIRAVLASRNGAEALMTVFSYIMRVAKLAPDELRDLLVEAGEGAGSELMTTFEDLAKIVRENALEEGREEGRTEGRAEILLRLLRARFGTLPGSVLARVRQAESEQLDAWAERILTAASLEAVFGEE
jgi:predicted transposase/invertase (TIGR01784 family)